MEIAQATLSRSSVPPTSFAVYFDRLFNKPATPLPTMHTSLSLDRLAFTLEDITYAITRTFTSNKLAGLASIPTQVLRSLDLLVHPLLNTFFQCVAYIGSPPTWWSILANPVFINKGSTLEPGNYCTICIMGPLPKLYIRCFKNYLSAQNEQLQ